VQNAGMHLTVTVAVIWGRVTHLTGNIIFEVDINF